MFSIKYVFCVLIFADQRHCNSSGKRNLVMHTVFGRIFCHGKPIGDSHTIRGAFFNKTHNFWETETRSFTEGSFMFEHSIPTNFLSDEHRMYLALETTACSKTGNILTLENKASLANDLGDLDFSMNDFVLHTVIGRIFCDRKPVDNSHYVYGDFGNKTHRFWDAKVRSYPNGTFIFEHFIPRYVLSDKHPIYLTLGSTACSKHGRILKFENETSSTTDLNNLDFMPMVTYYYTGRASCCEAPMSNKQVTIEMLKPSSGK
uniref:Uncharacterized protein n=1 Tax=Romanomermis culicivorax TaxID=13658 RepID=A0A915HNW3_ROMCU